MTVHLVATGANLDQGGGDGGTNVALLWKKNHNPGVGVQASAVQPAAGAGAFNVVEALSVVLTNSDVAAPSALVTVNLLDDVTVIQAWNFIVPAGGTAGIALAGLEIPSSVNKALTLQTSAAPAATVSASVNMSGKITNEI